MADGKFSDAVIDASTLADLLLGQGDMDVALLDHATLHVPTVLDYEVLSVARRLSRMEQKERAQQLVDGLGRVELVRHQAPRLIEPIWGLRENLTAYDAAYVALARSLDATLFTSDSRLARSAARYCDVVATS